MSVSILVVDDEPDVADLFRQRFRREARDSELVVVLSDINMPGMDGLEVLRKVKAKRPDLPVMMVTAYGDEERRRRASELAVKFRGVFPLNKKREARRGSRRRRFPRLLRFELVAAVAVRETPEKSTAAETLGASFCPLFCAITAPGQHTPATLKTS